MSRQLTGSREDARSESRAARKVASAEQAAAGTTGPADGSAPRRSSTLPTLRGFGFLVFGVGCAIVAYVIGRSELLFAAGFLVLLPLIAFLIVRLRPLRITVTRTFSPTVVTAGTPTVVELAVRNVSGLASPAATWTDRIPWFPHRAGPGALPVMPPGGSATPTRNSRLGYSLRPSLRGVYDIGPLNVSYNDPFGLAVGRLAVGGSQSLYVVPLVVPLGESVSLAVSGEGSARLIQHLATGNDDDLMTREYRTGDALRRVHWRASARHGELMVRQEEQRSYPEARLILDTRADGYGAVVAGANLTANGVGPFEWAITMIASVGVHLHRSGFLVQILETGPRQIAPLGDANQGSGQDMEFLLSLAGVGLTASAPIVGDANDERMLGALGPVFAVVANPPVESLRWIIAHRRPYEAGVAFVIESGNPAIAESLQAAGWFCVPVSEDSDPATAWAGVARMSAQTTGVRR
jgi:uncharacterized protein (DUF58 family)